jgi:transcriptional regulator with GAF, ATPase, and Fis domain
MTLNSVIACAMVVSSYAIAYTWKVKTDEPVISETSTASESETSSETGSQTSEPVSPAEKHMALLERVNDDLQEANSNWASYAEELSYKNRQLELELASSKTMVRTTIIVGLILFISYAALIYTAILMHA